MQFYTCAEWGFEALKLKTHCIYNDFQTCFSGKGLTFLVGTYAPYTPPSILANAQFLGS